MSAPLLLAAPPLIAPYGTSRLPSMLTLLSTIAGRLIEVKQLEDKRTHRSNGTSEY